MKKADQASTRYSSELREYEKDFFWTKKDADENIKYYFKIDDALIEVNYEIYMLCMRSAKKLEYTEKVQINRNYRSLDNEKDFVERELHKGYRDKSIDMIYQKDLLRVLYDSIDELDPKEKQIINGLFFEGLTERQLSDRIHMPQRTINYKKKMILKKLRHVLQDSIFHELPQSSRKENDDENSNH